MSHEPRECKHVYSAWTTTERTNGAGDRAFVFQRKCYQCPHVEEEMGAIVETPPEFHYAKTLEAGSEPDD